MVVDRLKPYFYKRFKTSFSKSGEDIQLWQLFKKDKGNFIDVGGHHPIFGNNSYFFYLRGWRGIVVEPNPIFEPLYKKFRPYDELSTRGVANFEGELEYFEMDGDLRNTFSKNYIEEFKLHNNVSNTNVLPVSKLSTIISNSSFESKDLDFLSMLKEWNWRC